MNSDDTVRMILLLVKSAIDVMKEKQKVFTAEERAVRLVAKKFLECDFDSFFKSYGYTVNVNSIIKRSYNVPLGKVRTKKQF